MPARNPGSRSVQGIFAENESVLGTGVEGFEAFGDEQIMVNEDDDVTGSSTGGGGVVRTAPPAPKNPVYVPPTPKAPVPVAPVKQPAFYEGDWMGLPKIAWLGAGAIALVVVLSKMSKKSSDEDYGY